MEKTRHPDCRIAIVGAGFAGLGMAIELQRAGIDSFIIYEAHEEVGGTWRDNTYPGCACDIPSHLYSYSYELNPDWSRTYSPQPEIQEYLVGCAETYGLYSKIRFNTAIAEAHYNEETGLWTLISDDGESLISRVLVLAVGGLRKPKLPDFPGLESFDGDWFHSARWDHDTELKNNRVGVVGTGASAVQIVPSIADGTSEVKVFQRSAPWVVPRKDYAYPAWVKRLFEIVPGLQRAYRGLIYGRHELQGMGLVRLHGLLEVFEWFARRYIRESFDHPQMRSKVTPDYTIGCKRILISSDYYPALNRPDVTLVDTAVERFTSDGIVDAEGAEHKLDTLVMATGFDIEGFLSHIDITGRGGRTLEKSWARGARAYYGVAASGFPNMYMLVGPNTGLGHNSIVFMIEAQAQMVRQAIELLIEEQASAMEVRPSVQRRFNQELRRRLEDTIWQTGGCHSWYVSEDGQNHTLWPGLTIEYWLRTRHLNRDDFRFSWKGDQVGG